jgi:hypothetical protein
MSVRFVTLKKEYHGNSATYRNTLNPTLARILNDKYAC